MADQTLKILIVDDDRRVAAALERALRKHKAVVETDSAAAARRLREGQWFDVVLSDNQMPEVTGLQLLELARRMPDPPIFVLISGDDNLGPNEADAMLAKPFKMDELSRLITAMSERKAKAPTQPIGRDSMRQVA